MGDSAFFALLKRFSDFFFKHNEQIFYWKIKLFPLKNENSSKAYLLFPLLCFRDLAMEIRTMQTQTDLLFFFSLLTVSGK